MKAYCVGGAKEWRRVMWAELKSEGMSWAELKSEGVLCGRS